ncbi:MAG: prolipoprotein diacylglyceryl transferase [Candidatus Angelobacter sp.]
MLQTVQQFLAALDPGYVWAGALLGALAYTVRFARREGLDSRIVYWAGVLAIVFGLWGGHLLGIVYYGTDGRPFAWLRFWSGGQAQFGGLIAGAIAVLLFLKVRKMSLLTYADAIAPAVALGVAIGRIGCFLNGDDFGSLSHLPWAVRFPPGTEAYADHFSHGWIGSTDALSLPVHPVQLYATLVWLGFFVILVVYHPEQAGHRLALFAILQGTGRFVEQFFRGDFQAVLGPFSLTQLIGLFFVAAGMGIGPHQRWQKSVDVAASSKLVSSQVGLGPLV